MVFRAARMGRFLVPKSCAARKPISARCGHAGLSLFLPNGVGSLTLHQDMEGPHVLSSDFAVHAEPEESRSRKENNSFLRLPRLRGANGMKVLSRHSAAGLPAAANSRMTPSAMSERADRRTSTSN